MNDYIDIETLKRQTAERIAPKESGPTKKIVGHAIAGGILAGPAGAVVGAIVGANKPSKKRKKW